MATYSIHTFQDLCDRFPAWPALRDHLTSPEGGCLRVVHEEGARFAVIRRAKAVPGAVVADPFFRSVVWDTEANRPVCVAPPKAREELPPIALPLAAVEDFVDGVMVNVFVRPEQPGVLHVATRTVLGGGSTFYGAKTFAEMFDEGLASTPLKDRAGVAAALEALRGPGKEGVHFASFVLQHPEHRVVAKVLVPSVFCVHVGSVDTAGVMQIEERALHLRLQVPSYPIRQFRSEQEIYDLLGKTGIQRGWRWQGLVFKDGAGGRWRLRTSTYQLLRELRGGESTVAERFLRLRGERKVKEYLMHYGEDREAMWELERRLHERTADVLTAYADVHKAHAVAFKDLPAAYKPAVFLLHVQWRDELRARGFKVRLQNAVTVVNAMKPFEQLRLLQAEGYVAVAPRPAQQADTAQQAGSNPQADTEPRADTGSEAQAGHSV